MKKIILAPLAILLFALFTQVEARGNTAYEMQRYCKDRAVRHYGIKRESIHLSVPRYLNGKNSIYGQSPKNRERALFFACHFSRNGRFLNIRTEKDLRRGDNANTKVTRAAKQSCKGEASSVWRVSPGEVRITHTRRINRGRHHLTMKARNRTAVCDVNAQGNIYSFKTKGNSVSSSRRAKKSCRTIASRFWMVPASRIQIRKTRKINKNRFHINVRYGRVKGKCDVSGTGHIYHFKTQL